MCTIAHVMNSQVWIKEDVHDRDLGTNPTGNITAPDLTALFSRQFKDKIRPEHNSQDALETSGIKPIEQPCTSKGNSNGWMYK